MQIRDANQATADSGSILGVALSEPASPYSFDNDRTFLTRPDGCIVIGWFDASAWWIPSQHFLITLHAIALLFTSANGVSSTALIFKGLLWTPSYALFCTVPHYAGYVRASSQARAQRFA